MKSLISFLDRLLLDPITLGSQELPFSVFSLFLKVLLPLVLILLVYRFLKFAFIRLADKFDLKEKIRNKILKWYKLIFRILYFVLILLFLANIFGARLSEYWRKFFNILSAPLISAGNTKISLVSLFLTIPIFYLASYLGKMSKKMINHDLLDRLGVDEAKRFSITSITRYVVMVIVLLFGLSIVGIDFSALTVIFGVLGIGIGFGLQNVVANMFAGFVIIFSQPIKENDRIIVEGHEAVVSQIRILSTIITTVTNEIIIVPNSSLVNNPIYNFSYNDRKIQIENDIGVAYSSDVESVIEILSDIGRRCPYNSGHVKPNVRLESFGDSSINFRLLTWIDEVNDKFTAISWINLEIWREFKRNAVEIPFPQRDIHIRDRV